MNDTLRILILEDNPADVELMEYELKEAGISFTSERALTREDFLHGLEKFAPDIILSDYDLPKFNGALALEEARERHPDVPFVLVTGAVSEDRAIEILTSGAKDYVLKNRLNRLAPAVKRAISEAREHKARKEAEAELRIAHRILEGQVRLRTDELRKEMAEHKLTIEKLRESEEKFRSAFDNSAVPMLISDRDGKLIQVNEHLAGMLSYTRLELAKKKFRELIHPDDLPAMEAGWAQMQTGEKNTIQMTNRLLRKDGRTVWVEASASIVLDALGKPLYFIAHLQNITKRKRAEEALRDNEEKCRLTIESSLNGVLMNIADGAIIRVNPAAQRMLDRTEKEVIEAGIEGIIDTKEPRFARAMDERARTGQFAGELNFRKKDGTFFPVEITSVLFRDSQGRYFASTMFQDISWQKQIEGLLQEDQPGLRKLADAAPLLIWTATPDGKIDYFNQMHEEFPNIKKENSGFWEWTSIVHPEDLPKLLTFMTENSKSANISRIKHRVRNSRGSYHWCLSSRAALLNQKGNVVKWIGTTTFLGNDAKDK